MDKQNLITDSISVFLLIVGTLFLLSGCSAIRDMSQSVKKPNVSVEDVRVTSFNFREMELTYDVKVENPNAISVQLLAYDYNLDVNKNTLVKGDQQQKLQIEASGESTFQIPMTLNFQDLYASIQSLRNTDEVSYDFLTNLTFELPIMGNTKLPVRKKGSIPVLKMPKIRIQDWSISNVSLSSAELSVQLAFDNPNGFGIDINGLDYDLMINGDQWASSTALKGVNIKENGITELNIPVSLNMSEMGLSAYRALTGSQNLDYRVKGNFDLHLQHELLGQTNFDFDRSGELSLSRK